MRWTEWVYWWQLLVCVGIARLEFVQGVKSCKDCPGDKVCLVENSAIQLNGGDGSIPISICNYESNSNTSFQFKLERLPQCDAAKVLVPQTKSTSTSNNCNKESCTITVTFQSPIDWAIAYKYTSTDSSTGLNANVLKARIVLPNAMDEDVKIGSFGVQAGATIASKEETTSICGNNIKITGTGFSKLDSCNSVRVCRGSPSTAANTCPTLVDSANTLRNVNCNNADCSGIVSLNSSFPCNIAASADRYLFIQLTVGDSMGTALIKTSKIEFLPATIANIDNFQAGSNVFTLSGDNLCASATNTLTLTSTNTSITAPALNVKTISTINNNISVTLASPIDVSHTNLVFKLQYTTCEQKSADNTFKVNPIVPVVRNNSDKVYPVNKVFKFEITGKAFATQSESMVPYLMAQLKSNPTNNGDNNTNNVVTIQNVTLQAKDDKKCILTLNSGFSMDTHSGGKLSLVLNVNGINSTEQDIGTICDKPSGCERDSNYFEAVTPKTMTNPTQNVTPGTKSSSTTATTMSAGFSGSLIVGIIIGAIACIGFLVELFVHRKKYYAKTHLAPSEIRNGNNNVDGGSGHVVMSEL